MCCLGHAFSIMQHIPLLSAGPVSPYHLGPLHVHNVSVVQVRVPSTQNVAFTMDVTVWPVSGGYMDRIIQMVPR